MIKTCLLRIQFFFGSVKVQTRRAGMHVLNSSLLLPDAVRFFFVLFIIIVNVILF